MWRRSLRSVVIGAAVVAAGAVAVRAAPNAGADDEPGVAAAATGATAAATAATATAASADEVLHALRIGEPRAFGHFIGDILVRRISFDLRNPYRLSPQDGVPKLGRDNPWVELIDTRWSASATATGQHVNLDLVYQAINSPVEPRLLTVPGAELHLIGGAERIDARLPDWLLSLAPLTGPDLRAGLEERRAARIPHAIDVRGPVLWAVMYAAAGTLFAAWFSVGHFGSRWFGPRAGPFARACPRLRLLAREPIGTERDRNAMRAVHRAFDETAGERVFAERLEDFFARHPRFAGRRNEVQGFFELSRAEFFGHRGEAELSIAALLRLCEQLRQLEKDRGLRHAHPV